MQSESPLEILSLKVQRHAAGRIYPFDRVYIFRKDLLEVATRATPNNLTFPIQEDAQEALAKLFVQQLQARDTGRGLYTREVSSQKRLSDEAVQGIGTAGVSDYLMRAFGRFLQGTDKNDPKNPWYQMVPILGTYRDTSGQRPAYLMNSRWAYQQGYQHRNRTLSDAVEQGASLRKFITDSGVLSIGEKTYTPPCLACVRLIHHLTGECEIGGAICYDNMSFGDDSYFLDGLNIAKQLRDKSMDEILDWIGENREETNGVPEHDTGAAELQDPT